MGQHDFDKCVESRDCLSHPDKLCLVLHPNKSVYPEKLFIVHINADCITKDFFIEISKVCTHTFHKSYYFDMRG
jgi:hypothetical protein